MPMTKAVALVVLAAQALMNLEMTSSLGFPTPEPTFQLNKTAGVLTPMSIIPGLYI